MVTEEARPADVTVASIRDHEWGGVLDPRVEVSQRANKKMKKPTVA